MIEYCICGHLEIEHYLAGCQRCWEIKYKELGSYIKFNIKHNYKLDNLKLIENLAKEKNLI